MFKPGSASETIRASGGKEEQPRLLGQLFTVGANLRPKPFVATLDRQQSLAARHRNSLRVLRARRGEPYPAADHNGVWFVRVLPSAGLGEEN